MGMSLRQDIPKSDRKMTLYYRVQDHENNKKRIPCDKCGIFGIFPNRDLESDSDISMGTDSIQRLIDELSQTYSQTHTVVSINETNEIVVPLSRCLESKVGKFQTILESDDAMAIVPRHIIPHDSSSSGSEVSTPTPTSTSSADTDGTAGTAEESLALGSGESTPTTPVADSGGRQQQKSPQAIRLTEKEMGEQYAVNY